MRRILTALALAALLALAACGNAREAAREGFEALQTEGAAAADTLAKGAEWVVCNAATVGAVRRRWGQSVEDAKVYAAFCSSPQDAALMRLDARIEALERKNSPEPPASPVSAGPGAAVAPAGDEAPGPGAALAPSLADPTAVDGLTIPASPTVILGQVIKTLTGMGVP